jgi:hypothetical integral membrane protein (TIGR02206 family)
VDWFGDSNALFEFDMFSVSHFAVLGVFVLIIAALFFCRNILREGQWRKSEILITCSFILFEAVNHFWMYKHGLWKLGRSLPLELCNIAVILSVILLLTKNRFVFEILFFLALAGATQAIITPALTYDFPHFRFFHFFYSHMMVVWVTLYFVWAKGYFISFVSVLKIVGFINVLLPAILFLNKISDGNYWFLRHKPSSHSILDILGPYPWYIFSLEGILIGVSFIAWLIARQWNRRPASSAIQPPWLSSQGFIRPPFRAPFLTGKNESVRNSDK